MCWLPCGRLRSLGGPGALPAAAAGFLPRHGQCSDRNRLHRENPPGNSYDLSGIPIHGFLVVGTRSGEVRSSPDARRVPPSSPDPCRIVQTLRRSIRLHGLCRDGIDLCSVALTALVGRSRCHRGAPRRKRRVETMTDTLRPEFGFRIERAASRPRTLPRPWGTKSYSPGEARSSEQMQQRYRLRESEPRESQIGRFHSRPEHR
mmetsp:Transcript_423/g.1087  ORF Transcript_423/g.1087 Transcript_423/m.1087 type:complete len:204 (-) Transcript_423:901-1512(-)